MIYLMRHGADDDSRLGGWSDAGLSEHGVEQVGRACEGLSRLGIARIFSSDLPRARETAEIVAERLRINVTLIKDFREANNGVLAGMPKERAKAEYPGAYWSALAWEEPYPGGESPAAFFRRVSTAWNAFKFEAEAGPRNVLLVTHGGPIDVILCCENGARYTNRRVNYRVECAEVVGV